MAQIARKLPSEAKPRMVNCDSGHSFFIAKGCILFFSDSGKKTRLWEVRAFSPQTKPLTEKNNIQPLAIKKECPESQFTILGFASEGNLRAIWAILYFSRLVL